MENNPIPDLPKLPVGTVMYCTRVIQDREYHYVWLKTERGWYTSGTSGSRSDVQFGRWLANYRFGTPHRIATEWEDVPLTKNRKHTG